MFRKTLLVVFNNVDKLAELALHQPPLNQNPQSAPENKHLQKGVLSSYESVFVGMLGNKTSMH